MLSPGDVFSWRVLSTGVIAVQREIFGTTSIPPEPQGGNTASHDNGHLLTPPCSYQGVDNKRGDTASRDNWHFDASRHLPGGMTASRGNTDNFCLSLDLQEPRSVITSG